MKRLCPFLSLFLLLSVIILNGCGISHSPNPNSTPTSSPFPTPTPRNIMINTYDKDTGECLSDVSFSIIETNLNGIISGNPYQHTLAQGCYTIYLTKPGYIARGFVFNLTSDLVLNVYLRQKSEVQSKGSVSGKVQENGSDYGGSFNIYTGNQFTSDYFENLTNPFEVSSVCGEIAVSAFTRISGSIDKITYVTPTLQPGSSLTGLSLELPSTPTVYSGSKPSWDQLVVRQKDGFTLASQNSASTNYVFGIEVAPGDRIILESSQTIGNTNYFRRIDAGGIGGSNNIQYQIEVPYSQINSVNDSYVIDINPVNFASYYEVYAIQIKDDVGKVPFQTIVLGEATVKIPKSLFESGTDTTYIYVRAINLEGFNINNMIDGSQVYANYSYVEREYETESLGLSSYTFKLKNIDKIKMQIRSRFGLNHLCTE